MKHNCMKPTPNGTPLIHEIHGEPYKIVKAVYLALPWLWSKLGMFSGSLVNTVYLKATLTTTEPVQILPYPPNVTMQNIRNSVLWATTKDDRRYKYRNCYLTETGLHINIDLQAPEPQRGIKVVWNIMLAASNKSKCHCGPPPFKPPCGCQDIIPPFHYHEECDCCPPPPCPPFPFGQP